MPQSTVATHAEVKRQRSYAGSLIHEGPFLLAHRSTISQVGKLARTQRESNCYNTVESSKYCLLIKIKGSDRL